MAVAVLTLLAAAVVWFATGTPSSSSLDAEARAALRGIRYRVRCAACNETSEMDAIEYHENLGPEGVRCSHCGEKKAWKYARTDDPDPTLFKDEVARITSSGEAAEAARAVHEALVELEAQINAAESENDAAKLADLKKQRVQLQAKQHAIGLRHSELMSQN